MRYKKANKGATDWSHRSSDTWSVGEVRSWLQSRQFDSGVLAKFECHCIDGVALSLLTEGDLQEMQVTQVGLRKRLMNAVRQACHTAMAKDIAGDIDRNRLSPSRAIPRSGQLCQTPLASLMYSELNGRDVLPVDNNHHPAHKPYRTRSDTQDSDLCFSEEPSYLDPEPWKVALSFLYVFLVFGITAFVMVLAHERLPDMSKYPPLPDLLLDNLPYIPWAFEAAESVGVVLLLMWIVILVFHRHRFILQRRLNSLTGTIFLLRSVTMLITSLSVPGQHLHEQCKPYKFKDTQEKFVRAFHIWMGFGMSLQGVQTCGDYMFSGHTVCLTLLNFFITEYTPRKAYHIHIVTWLLNIFGIFFILAGHEHYSIDVFIAFYISSRLFLYYHWISNNQSNIKREQSKVRVWFPLFAFFEGHCTGPVPNEFEIPFRNFFRRMFTSTKKSR